MMNGGRSFVAGRGIAGLLVITWFLLLAQSARLLNAQTEGDTGYDYNEAYDDYDEDSVSGLEPAFDVPIVNVTVVAGQTALLPCSIDYLGKYKVAWLDHKSIPLTYEDRRVVDDFRFSVVRPYVKEWNLQIRDIKWEDQGQYRCTINTSPVKSKIVMLHVKVPATIIDELSSDDTTVQEGDVVVLVCNVTGVPTPDVTWYRRPASPGKAGERERIGMVGEMIIIQNVSRYCDDIYECVASNGVPPSVSRQMRVTVEFEPEIRLPNRRMGQVKGRETILECYITAYPQAVNYWEKDSRQVINSKKHRVDAYDNGDNTLVLNLRISDIDSSDYGEYKCVASNALGRDEESMYLYEYIEADPEKTTSTQPTVPFVTYFPRLPVTPRKQAYSVNYAASSTSNSGSTSAIRSIASGVYCAASLQLLQLLIVITAYMTSASRLIILTSSTSNQLERPTVLRNDFGV
jgi:neuronal growth regulator 1